MFLSYLTTGSYKRLFTLIIMNGCKLPVHWSIWFTCHVIFTSPLFTDPHGKCWSVSWRKRGEKFRNWGNKNQVLVLNNCTLVIIMLALQHFIWYAKWRITIFIVIIYNYCEMLHFCSGKPIIIHYSEDRITKQKYEENTHMNRNGFYCSTNKS